MGDTGLRYEIASHRVDLLPFGELEHPTGTVAPPTREDPISVWAFIEVYKASLPLRISPTDVVRLPTIPGYTATKLAAWLDRLSRAGNRRMNHMIHIAAITQLRLDTDGRVYYRRKRAEGKRPLEAIRFNCSGLAAGDVADVAGGALGSGGGVVAVA